MKISIQSHQTPLTRAFFVAVPLLLSGIANAATTSYDINAAAVTDDVVIQGATSQTLASGTTVNSLTITPSATMGLILGSNALTITSGSLNFSNNTTGIIQGGSLNFGAQTAEITAGRGYIGYNNVATAINGSGGVNYSGGILFLSRVKAQYAGATTVKAGTLYFQGNSTDSNRIADTSALTINAGASLADTGVSSVYVTEVIGSLAGAGTIGLSTRITLDTGGNNTSTTFSGAWNGASNLIKNGTGAFTYAGVGTNAGLVTVKEGSFIADGTLNGGSTTVASGGTLGGSGTLGVVTVQSGGTISAGTNGAGKLTIATGLTLAGNTIVDIAGTSRGITGGYDAIDIGADQLLAYGGVLTLGILGEIDLGAATSATYDLFSFTGTTVPTGDFTSLEFASGGYYSGTFIKNGNLWTATSNNRAFEFNQATGDMLIQVVPEPTTSAMLILGASGLALALNKRRHMK